MEASQDTEITLGTAKLLGLFFGLVMICAVFFSLGYTLGRKSEPGLTATAGTTTLPASPKAASPSAQPAVPMTFYKSVEQKDANPQLTPVADSNSSPDATTAASSPSASPAQSSPSPNLPDPMTLPTASYFVQVAAVSKPDDADALVEALKKKQYAAFVAANSSTDKLFHVQVGPFSDIKEAEATRSRLINDGYNPILKK